MMRRERGRVIGRRRTEVGPEAEDARPHRNSEDRDRRQVSLQSPTKSPVARRNVAPGIRVAGAPASSRPIRILVPARSCMTATCRPARLDADRIRPRDRPLCGLS